MFVMIPLNGVIFSQMTAIRRIKMKETDKRVKLMNEILSGIRVIKYYAWEYAFTQKIRLIRSRELDLLRQLAYIVAVGFTLIMMSAPLVQPILIFFVYVKLGNQLDAARAFTTLSLFNVLAFLPPSLSLPSFLPLPLPPLLFPPTSAFLLSRPLPFLICLLTQYHVYHLPTYPELT